MGRPRSKFKDLPLGVFEAKGRYFVRPVNEEMRAIFAIAFAGRKSAPLGADKAEMRKAWVKLFATEIPKESGATGTVAEIIERYEREVVPHLDPKPRKEAARYCVYLRTAFGARRYAKSEAEASTGAFVRTMDVQRHVDEGAKAARPVAVNREVKCLSRMFKLAKTRWGYTEYNPCLQVEYNPETPRSAYHDDDAFMHVYKAASPVLQCMMDLAQMHGARRGMLIKATLACLTTDGVLLPLNKRKKTEVQRYQIIEWNDDLRAVIARVLELRSKVRGGQREVKDHATAPLFLTRRGKAYGETAFNVMWRRARQKAGVGAHVFHFHDIKAKSLSDSPNVIDAMNRGGHMDVKTTRRVYMRKPTRVVPLPRVSRSPKRS